YIAPWSGRFYSLWDTGYAKIHIPIIASVSEHQPTTWVSFFFDLHILVCTFPAGLWFCIKNINDERVFVFQPQRKSKSRNANPRAATQIQEPQRKSKSRNANPRAATQIQEPPQHKSKSCRNTNPRAAATQIQEPPQHKSKSRRNTMALYAISAVYFAGVMVRLMLTLTPVVCMLSAVAFSSVFEHYMGDDTKREKPPAEDSSDEDDKRNSGNLYDKESQGGKH
ncbi:hypothetical protein CRENBAI_022524, partial [Crenichthys baileyi]